MPDPSRDSRWLLLTTLLAALLTGCNHLGHYLQAIGGHIEVVRAAVPIEHVVGDAASDPALRQQLQDVQAIREFASRELGLPDNGSYRAYADLGRPYVVWNVVAALRASWGAHAGYDAFFGTGLNNASLASLALYSELVPAFAALLTREGHNLPRFYPHVVSIAALGEQGRRAALLEIEISRSGGGRVWRQSEDQPGG